MAKVPSSLLNSSSLVSRNIDNSMYDRVKSVADHMDNILVVSADLESVPSSIEEVALNIDDVKFVGTNIDAVKAIGDNIGDINQLVPVIPQMLNISDNMTEVKTVSTKLPEITNVHNHMNNVDRVGTNIDSVVTVSNITPDVLNVSTNMGAITRVSNNINNVNTVATNIAQVNNLSSISTNITNVDANKTNINNVSINMDKVVTVSNNMDDINHIIPYLDEIVIDANNISDIVTVANDLSLAGWSNISDAGMIIDPVEQEDQGLSLIETVANNIANVNLTGSNITSVNTVAPHIDDVHVVATNIVDVQNAEENAIIAITKAGEASTSATNALNSENKARAWAITPENEIVEGTWGVDDKYSAYHWAMKAEASAGGNVKISTLYDVDLTGGVTNGNLLQYDSTTMTWKPYDFNANDKVSFDLNPTVTLNQGDLSWNTDEGTLNLGLANGSALQVGQENIRIVRNATGVTIPNGTVVMFNGTIGASGRVKVKPFTATPGSHHLVYGIATQDILTGTDGIITIDGKVRGINTTGSIVGETWLDGDVLYVKPNDAGKLTKVEPIGIDIKMPIATVIYSHHTAGVLEVRVLPIDENQSYTKTDTDNNFVPLNTDFSLDLGGL